MLTLKKIKKSFAARRILDGVSFSIGDMQRVALVGQNGVGKSTLLKIIAGLETPDRGEIILKKNALVGYLPQETIASGEVTVREYLFQQSGLSELEKQMKDLEPRLRDEKAQREYSDLGEQYRRLGGFAFEDKAKYLLEGLLLQHIPFGAPLATLSGGEKRKLALIGVLLRGVDFLLLDEPTNNLDLPALLWLERYLVKSNVTVLVASHDRRFLDRVVKKVIEIDFEKRQAEIYSGNWSAYFQAKAHARRRHRELYKVQELEKIRVVESADEKRGWIEKAKAKARRDNDKMLRGFKVNRSAQKHSASARALENRVKRLDKLEKPFMRTPLEFQLPTVDEMKPAIEMEKTIIGYRAGYRSHPLTLRISFGKRVALLGQNGAGKTTLLKTLSGALKPLKGKVKRARGLEIGDLMQEHENIPRDKTPLQYFAQFLGIHDRERVLLLLSRFQFTPEFSETKIGDFSPGERVRFILAVLAEKKNTLILLDEPTNHLDLEAIEALEEALEDYPGTVLLVTHDRTFLERVRVDETYLLDQGELEPIESYQKYEATLRPEVNRLLRRLDERLGKA